MEDDGWFGSEALRRLQALEGDGDGLRRIGGIDDLHDVGLRRLVPYGTGKQTVLSRLSADRFSVHPERHDVCALVRPV